MIQKLDTGRLEHWADIYPAMFSMPGAVLDGEHWFLPIDWGNGSLLYRTDLVEPEEMSWKLAFDERYRGKIAMYNSKPLVTVAALVLGIDPFQFGDDEAQRINELLLKQRELVRFYWSSPTEYQQAMASGEIAIAYAWNDGLLNLRKQGLPVAYMQPKEGILTWSCGLVHMADGKAPSDLVYDFLNALSSPETGKFLIESYNYGHCNSKALALADPATVEDLGFTSPNELFATGVFETEVTPEMDERRNRLLEAAVSGIPYE